MDLRKEAHQYLQKRLIADIDRLRQTEEGAKQGTLLYTIFAGRFSFKPLTLLMANVHEQIAEAIMDDDIGVEEFVNLWLFDYAVGLSTHMDGLVENGYQQLESVLMQGVERYLNDPSIPSGIKERANAHALQQPLVLLFFLMYDVIVVFNEQVTNSVRKAESTH